MSDIFISYARSTEAQAERIAESLRALGYGVWRDDELPAHRAYAEVIEERLKAAKAVVVLWSAEAVKSHWVRAEADAAREVSKLVQLSVDGTAPPMPFNQIQYADLARWTGDPETLAWKKVLASIADLAGSAHESEPAPRLEMPPPLPGKPSIAVLPFANLSGDPKQDYFADGMVEEISAALSRFKSLFVVAAGSGLSFKGRSYTAQEAARELGVRFVLQGSIRTDRKRVRIATELVDATDGSQLWADRFDDTLEDVFALQDKVALSVAGVIQPAIRSADRRRAVRRPTQSLSSYDLFLRAWALGSLATRAEMLEAIELLDRAIALDPEYGLALACAAYSHAMMSFTEDTEKHLRDGLDLASRAMKVAPDDPQVLSYVASTLFNLGQDLEAAIAIGERAVALNPGDEFGWGCCASMYAAAGRPDRALEALETAMRLSPCSPTRHIASTIMGWAYFEQHRFREAITPLRESAQAAPGYPTNHALIASCCGHLGEAAAGRDALARFRDLLPSLEPLAWFLFRAPEHHKLFMEGIAIVEARDPLSPAIGP